MMIFGWLRKIMHDDIGDPQALRVLLELYDRRVDLQEVFPEVRNGDSRRLIDWAAGASTRKWKDSSYETLAPYSAWYSHNYTGNWPALSPPALTDELWAALEKTSNKSANPIPVTLSVVRDRSAIDINLHLVTLSMLVIEFDLKQIVELGTADGSSTLALLEAARMIGGKVLSIDIEPCLDAKRKVEEAGLVPFWKFLETDDLEVEPNALPESIDLLVIDTNHVYAQTIAELKKYRAHLKDGSWIALHDYVSYPGVNRAVNEFIESLPRKPRFYPFLHQNGLALLRLLTSQQHV